MGMFSLCDFVKSCSVKLNLNSNKRDNDGVIYGSVYVHRVVALVGIISTLRLSICLVGLPNLDKLMSRCRVKMTQINILSF